MNGKKCWVFVTNVKKPWVFVTRRRTKFESSDKNSRFFNVSDKNSTFFAVSDKNSRSEGQNKFLPSRGTKIKTWVTTRNFCTLLRDKSNKILILNDKNWFQKISRPKKRPKNPVILPPQQKKACQKHRKCFVLVSQVFMSCEFVFLYIAGENMIFFQVFCFQLDLRSLFFGFEGFILRNLRSNSMKNSAIEKKFATLVRKQRMEKYSSCFSWLFWEKNIFLYFFGRKTFFFTFLGEKRFSLLFWEKNKQTIIQSRSSGLHFARRQSA